MVQEAIWAAMFGPGSFARVREVLDENRAMDLWLAYAAKNGRATARGWLVRHGVVFTETADSDLPDNR